MASIESLRDKYLIPDHIAANEIELVKARAGECETGIDAIKYIRTHLCVPLKYAAQFHQNEVDKDGILKRQMKERLQDAAPDLLKALIEAKLQIEYLHGKFQETGSGSGVLARINAVLAKARGEQP